MPLSPQNQQKLRQFKKREFPPTFLFVVKVLKGVIEADFIKLDSQVKSISSAMYKHGGIGFVKAQLELNDKKNRMLAILHRLDNLS
tara:strand:+ start:295 stop:552 length:258 start_codon:yes stop_codon:yes gene_type:complete